MIIDRLQEFGGTSGHVEMQEGYDYDSICTAIDTELYKLVTLQMLEDAEVKLCLNTMLVGADVDQGRIGSVLLRKPFRTGENQRHPVH